MIVLFIARKCDNCNYVKGVLRRANIVFRLAPVRIFKEGTKKIYPELVNLLAELAMLNWNGTAPVACWNGEALTYEMICSKLGVPVHKCEDGVCKL